MCRQVHYVGMFVQLHYQPANQVQCTHLRRRRRIRIQIRMGGYRLFLLLPFRAAAFYRFNNKRGAESLDSANRQSHNHDVLCLMAMEAEMAAGN